MDTGSMEIQVYTSRGRIPLEDASVVVLKPGEKDEIIAIEVTNTSGFTRKIEIPTPSPVASTRPVKMQGFTSVNVWVEHPDFVTTLLENVQIFPNVDTKVPVELTPLEEGSSSLEAERQLELSQQNL